MMSLNTTAQQPTFLTDGLIAYYPFNGSATDAITGKESVVTRATLTSDMFGRPNRAFSFSGGSSITCPDVGFPAGNSPRTLSLWINFTPMSVSADVFIAYGATFDPMDAYYGMAKSDVFYVGQSFGVNYPSAGIKPNRWYHVSFSHDGKLTKLYIDGKLAATGNRTYNTTLSGRFYIGSYINPEDNPINSQIRGSMNNVRVYNRALSDLEVESLYENELTPAGPRTAVGTLQLVNGFVVGATIIDGGSGYTNIPNVTITGGGGSGALATATVLNGKVTALTIKATGNGYTGNPSVVIENPPYPPLQAFGIARVANGSVTGVFVYEEGYGYGTNIPRVHLLGGGGSGAKAVAVLQDGKVVGVTMTETGSGYTSAPRVVIAAPPGFPSVKISVNSVKLDLSLIPGYTYQIQTSTDATTWTNVGDSFLATETTQAQVFEVTKNAQLFKVLQLP